MFCMCVHESLAARASPDGIFWISGSVLVSALILTPLYLVRVCPSICAAFRDGTDRILIIVQNCHIHPSFLPSYCNGILLRLLTTTTVADLSIRCQSQE